MTTFYQIMKYNKNSIVSVQITKDTKDTKCEAGAGEGALRRARGLGRGRRSRARVLLGDGARLALCRSGWRAAPLL